MRTASAVNLLMGDSKSKTPEVGMGGTVLMWTDRVPVTVIAVKGGGTTVIVQEDRAIRTDSNGLSESQSYRFEPDRAGPTSVYTLRKNGAWVRMKETINGGTRLLLGVKGAYRDPSF